MVKVKKPAFIERVTNHKTGRQVDIQYHWDDQRFHADPKDGGQVIVEATVDECRRKATEMLKTSFAFEWREIIDVAEARWGDEDEEYGISMEFRFSRHETAFKADGMTKVLRPHRLDVTEEWQKEERANGNDVKSGYDARTENEIPYEQDVWDGLVRIMATLKEAKRFLNSVIANPAGITKALASGKTAALALPEKTKGKKR